jgi:hypothetical protein
MPPIELAKRLALLLVLAFFLGLAFEEVYKRGARRRQVAEAVGSSSHPTPRWREVDSNPRSPVEDSIFSRPPRKPATKKPAR